MLGPAWSSLIAWSYALTGRSLEARTAYFAERNARTASVCHPALFAIAKRLRNRSRHLVTVYFLRADFAESA